MIKLKPVIKEYIWGTESWQVSTHPDGLSTIANGINAGKTLKEVLGHNLPILIKIIDAHDNLSLQVHPNDEYAHRVENQSGKNEMWYITAAQPGAELILGFKEPLSKDELRNRIQNNTILEKVNYVPVKAGDCYCVPAGMLHAIGKGIKIIEVQQSSNVTYRVYDYDRRDSHGNPRELHIDKAIDVLDTTLKPQMPTKEPVQNANTITLADWDYFHSELQTAQDGKTQQLRCNVENFETLTTLETGETVFIL